jgi:cytochrome b subunit of formate dehydrogenase
MKPRLPIQSFARWTVFIFILMLVSGKIEHRVSIAVGSHLSSDFAQWIADVHKSANAMKAKDPDAFQYVTTRMGFASMAVEGITAAIISGFIIWWRRDSRGMPPMRVEESGVK